MKPFTTRGVTFTPAWCPAQQRYDWRSGCGRMLLWGEVVERAGRMIKRYRGSVDGVALEHTAASLREAMIDAVTASRQSKRRAAA